VNDEHRNAGAPVQPYTHGAEQPSAPVRFADDDEVPATGSSLAEEGGCRSAARDELRNRDVLGHLPRGLLDVPFRPAQELLLEPIAANGEHDRTGRTSAAGAPGRC
jgi:hypothetical protein